MNPVIDPISGSNYARIHQLTNAAIRNWVRRGKVEILEKRGRENVYSRAALDIARTTRRPWRATTTPHA
jgi:hypothetical protein